MSKKQLNCFKNIHVALLIVILYQKTDIKISQQKKEPCARIKIYVNLMNDSVHQVFVTPKGTYIRW